MKNWSWWILAFNGIWYNCYFGWNMVPKSDAEMICDMLFGIMAILVFSTKDTSHG